MPVVQGKYADKHRPSKSSTADLLPGGVIIRAINDNLNEHIEDTAENFKQVHSKLDGLSDDVSTLKGDVSTLKGDVSTLKADVKAIRDYMESERNGSDQ